VVEHLPSKWEAQVQPPVPPKENLNIGVQISLLHADLQPFRCMPRNGLAGTYCSSRFLKDLHTDFHSGWTNLCFHQQGISITFSHILTSPFCYLFSWLFGLWWYGICHFDVNFLYVAECWAFNISSCIYLPFVFFWEMSVQFIDAFVNWIICYLLLIFKVFIYYGS
jgi:hypothetical protein